MARNQSEVAFHQFQAHPTVMIGALPEACLVVLAVDVTLRVTAPPPLAAFTVDKVKLDILPATESFL